MALIIGFLADAILYWVILSPETPKEIAIFSLIAYLSISLDVVTNTLSKASMGLGFNLMLDSMKPYVNIISCISGIVLWKLITPETLLGAILFLTLWLSIQFFVGLIWGSIRR